MVGTAGAGALRVNCLTSTPYRVLISAGGSGNVNARRMTALRRPGQLQPLHLRHLRDRLGQQHRRHRDRQRQDQLLPVYGRVPVQATPLSGTYTDTVTVTVSW